MILRSANSRTRPTIRKVRTGTVLRPLRHRLDPAQVEEIPFHAGDGVRLGLTRIDGGERDRPAVLLLHGHTASADMFLLPETRNLVDVLLDDGYEPWLLDWRGSRRKLPTTRPVRGTPTTMSLSTTSPTPSHASANASATGRCSWSRTVSAPSLCR